jgi:hypothetical protein
MDHDNARKQRDGYSSAVRPFGRTKFALTALSMHPAFQKSNSISVPMPEQAGYLEATVFTNACTLSASNFGSTLISPETTLA